jgi:hypothetical protein
MTRLLALVALGLIAALPAAADAAAKPKHRTPSQLWYRVSVEGQGRSLVERPDNAAGAQTQQTTTGFKVKSRTAVIIYRTAATRDPREDGPRRAQYNTTAGLSGRATAFSRTATLEATEYCTRQTYSETPVAYAMLDGSVSFLSGPGYNDVTFGLDYGLDPGLSHYEDSGRECRDSSGSLYFRTEPRSAQRPGAWGGLLCDKTNPRDPQTVRTVTGRVAWGRAFDFRVKCQRNESSGANSSISNLDFTVSFKPCPRHGRRVESC